mgnify:CR=1 FL=1
MSDLPREEKKQKVIEVLNKARSMELYAIHQYMNQHYNLDDQDYGELAGKLREISIDEMRHAEWFAERIKDLDGEPTSKMDGMVAKGQDVHDVFSFDRDVEDDTLVKYNEFLAVCREMGDYVSSNLFEKVIIQEQDHWDYFDDTDSHIKKLGDHFLARMAATADDE